MTELTIHGRGGQGGVTLAKLIATSYFLQDKHVQAFGVYAAERSGAPLQAYVRIDDVEITNHNLIHEPDHMIVLDRTLIGPQIAAGLKPDGWIIINTSESPSAFADVFAGRRVATVDATSLAVENGLGTRAVPIVNTTMLGAVAAVFDLNLEDIEAALAEINFGGGNLASARAAFDQVEKAELGGTKTGEVTTTGNGSAMGILDEATGQMPRIKTGSWATSQPERQTLTPPCNQGCPAGNDVRGFVEAVGKEDCTEALRILYETSPFPGICGRVCPAPCMDACNRSSLDSSVNIRELERYAAEHGQRPDPVAPTRDEPIAVVGSGPAGLSATYHLARLGYKVTLFEGGQELGGVMRTGIPAYRLPSDVLGEEISHILRHGVEVQTGKFMQRQDVLDLSHNYAAVFLGTGLQDSRTLNLGKTDQDCIEQGIDFLERVRHGGCRLDGEQVIVVGGGNTAIDAARSARRLGAKRVQIVYRRTRAQMPAIAEEIEEAVEEGINLNELVSPLRLQQDGVGLVLTCQRMVLGEPDESGRPRPMLDTSEDAMFDLSCDRVILALGQTTNISILPEGSEIREDGTLLGLSGGPIFAGGDFATNEGTVTAAIGSGRKAAYQIHCTLTGEDLLSSDRAPVANPEAITMHLFSRSPRKESGMIAASERTTSFSEVRLGLIDGPGDQQAVHEAQRCFSCGVCNECDRCTDYCPEGIVLRDADTYRFDYGYCKGCGICATQCPRGVIYMSEL